MSFQIVDAVRSQKFPKILISGPSGSGKTLTSILILVGMGAKYEEIAVIDTEHSSSALYANSKPYGVSENVGQFKIIPFEKPYSLKRYIEAIKFARDLGVKYLVVDSISHSWMGEGGALDQVNDATASSKSGNSYAAWKNVTPLFGKFIEEILAYPGAVVCTVRSKQEYSQETNPLTGKKEIRKVGMAPVIRDGIEYEFDTVFDMDTSHTGMASKDRTGLFSNQQLIMDTEIGRKLESWRNNGSVTAPDYFQIAQASSAQSMMPQMPQCNPVQYQPQMPPPVFNNPPAPQQYVQVPPPPQQNVPIYMQNPAANVIAQAVTSNAPIVRSLQEETDRLVALFNQYSLEPARSKELCVKALNADNTLSFRDMSADQLYTCYEYVKKVMEAGTPQVNNGVMF